MASKPRKLNLMSSKPSLFSRLCLLHNRELRFKLAVAGLGLIALSILVCCLSAIGMNIPLLITGFTLLFLGVASQVLWVTPYIGE